MKTLIPTLIAVLFIGTAHAQDGSYATLTNQTSAKYSSASAASEPYIKVKGKTDRKILLSWAAFPGGVSHYVLERSFDGHTFDEQGIFFTGDWEDQTEYSYVEKLRRPAVGPLFYRLRIVGVDGSVVYTPVTIFNATPAAN